MMKLTTKEFKDVVTCVICENGEEKEKYVINDNVLDDWAAEFNLIDEDGNHQGMVDFLEKEHSCSISYIENGEFEIFFN